MGAVVLEYTPLYNESMRLTGTTIQFLILAGFGSVALALLIAFNVGRSIVRRLEQLTNAAMGFASGRMDLPVASSRKDEIGQLATAFDNMVQKRRRAEDELRRLRDELEVRVAERVAELAAANEALRTENAERKRGEETLRRSEEKFRQLADNISDVFWMTSPDLKVVH
jgi:nitrate/nitrite-specific signal transduction histidine kinase